MLGLTASQIVYWSNEVRIWGAVATVFLGIITCIAQYTQIRYSSIASKQKDEEFEHYKIDAQKEVANANKLASEARRDQEILRNENLKLQSAIDEQRAQQQRLHGAVASRQISEVQQARLFNSLQANGKFKELQVTQIGDAEASNYAQNIIAVIQGGGVKTHVSYVGIITPPVYGLLIKDLPDSWLASAFNSAGIDFELLPSWGQRPELIIGLKKPGL